MIRSIEKQRLHIHAYMSTVAYENSTFAHIVIRRPPPPVELARTLFEQLRTSPVQSPIPSISVDSVMRLTAKIFLRKTVAWIQLESAFHAIGWVTKSNLDNRKLDIFKPWRPGENPPPQAWHHTCMDQPSALKNVSDPIYREKGTRKHTFR